MNILHRRHLALFCIIYAGVMLLCRTISEEKSVFISVILLIAMIVLIIAIFCFKKYRPISLKIALCFLFAFTAVILPLVRVDLHLRKVADTFNNEVKIEGVVNKVNYQSDYFSSYIIKTVSVDDRRFKSYAIVNCEYNAEVIEGDTIKGVFLINDIDACDDYVKYYRSKGVQLYLYAEKNDIQYIGHNETLKNTFIKLNKTISETIHSYVKGDAGDMISALILGDKDNLSDSIIRDFRRTGLSHIIAISGMHLSIMMTFFEFTLKKFKIKNTIRSSIVILIALFYLALTGFSLSTVRAFIMSFMVYVSYVVNADSDMLTSLLVALTVILFISPFAIYDIGLWLSFLSVLGIIISMYFISIIKDKIYSRYRGKRNKPIIRIKIIVGLISSVMTTFVICFLISFLALLYFSEMSLISILTNLIASPIASVLLFITMLLLFLNLLGVSVVAIWAGKVIQILCDVLLLIVSKFSSISGITVSLKYSFAPFIIIPCFVAFIILLIINLKRKYFVFTPILSCIIAFGIAMSVHNQYYSQVTEIEFISNGESEYTLVHDGKNYSIIDMTNGGYRHCKEAYYDSVDNCATEIFCYVLTHYHNYHIVSLNRLFSMGMIKTLFLPSPITDEEYYHMLGIIESAVKNDVNYEIYKSNDIIWLGKSTNICVSERKYISRSTHPLFMYEISGPSNAILYVSESVWEDASLNEKLVHALNSYKSIIFGTHGPKVRKEFNYNFNNTKSKVLLTNVELEKAINSSSYPKNEFKNVARATFILPTK